MVDEKKGGGSGEGPPKVIPIRPSQDSQRPLSPENLRLVDKAREVHEDTLQNAPTRARVLTILRQHSEIYEEIKKGKTTPQEILWITRPSAYLRSKLGGTLLHLLPEFFEKLAEENAPAEEILQARKAISRWLKDNFAHEKEMEPVVYLTGDDTYFLIRWVRRDRPPEPEPLEPAE